MTIDLSDLLAEILVVTTEELKARKQALESEISHTFHIPGVDIPAAIAAHELPCTNELVDEWLSVDALLGDTK